MTGPECDAIRCMLSDLLADALDPAAVGQVAAHLTDCRKCRALAEAFTWQDLALGELVGNAQQEAMAARIHDALRPQLVPSQASGRPAAIVAYPLGNGWGAKQAAATVPWWIWSIIGTAAAVVVSLSTWFIQNPKPEVAGPRVVIHSPPVEKSSPHRPVEPTIPPVAMTPPQSTGVATDPTPAKPVPLATVVQVEGEAYRLGDGTTLLKVGEQVFPGQGLETRGEASLVTVRYRDGTTLQLAADTLVRHLTEEGGKWVELAHGAVTADVERQSPGKPMVLSSPKADAIVLGTKLRLSAGADNASLSVEKGLVRFIRSEDGRSLEVPQGHYAVVAKDVEFAIRPIAPATPRWVVFREHTAALTSLAYTADGRTLATASNDATVKLWDVATRTVRATLRGHTAPVEAVALSPDGQTLASAGWDRTVRLWDVATGRLKKTLEGHASTVFAVAFAPDGQTLASGSSDKSVKLWDLASGKQRTTLEGHQGAVRCVLFSPDGKLLGSGGADGTVAIWDTATGKRLRQMPDHNGWIYRLAFSPDGGTVAAGSGDGVVSLWDVAAGAPQQRLSGHTKRITGLSFAGGGQRLVSSSMDGSVRFWDPASGKELQRFSGEPLAEVAAVGTSPDGKSLAIGNWDGSLVLWNLGQ